MNIYKHNNLKNLYKMRFYFDDLYTAKSYKVDNLEDKYLISIVAPGVKKESFKLEIINGILKIRVPEQREKSFTIPSNTDTSDISAEYLDGILKIEIKKKPLNRKMITVN